MGDFRYSRSGLDFWIWMFCIIWFSFCYACRYNWYGKWNACITIYFTHTETLKPLLSFLLYPWCCFCKVFKINLQNLLILHSATGATSSVYVLAFFFCFIFYVLFYEYQLSYSSLYFLFCVAIFLYRSPWSNKYHPPLEDGSLPSEELRKLEIEANDIFAIYRDQWGPLLTSFLCYCC